MEKLRGRVVLKFSMFALVGVVGLLPTEASAQFPIPIPLPFPHIDLGRRPPVSHSVPSHHSGAPENREENKQNNSGTTEKDANSGGDLKSFDCFPSARTGINACPTFRFDAGEL